MMLETLKYIFILTVVLGTILVIITENRNPVKTIAWCLALIFMPFIGIILYILFGMDNRHRRLIRKEEYDRLKGMTKTIQSDDIVSDIPDRHKPLARMLYKANRAYPLSGNDVEIMTDFITMSDRLVTDIENARHHINILFFKFEDDIAGRKVADALIRKAEEGVQVRLIYDEAGNMMVPRRFYSRLRENGIQVRGFIRIFLPILSRDYNSRNHRKVVVIDGKVGYMHAKTLVIDDSFVTIGSTNIDFRGFEQDFEINAFIYDSDMADQQRDIFIRDQKDCEEVIPEEWEKRPRIEKAKESFARIFSQVL